MVLVTQDNNGASICADWKIAPITSAERRLRHTALAEQALVPLSIFLSNSKFDENSERSSFKYTCKISLWSAAYILHYSVLNFHRISNSIEICLVGRAPGACAVKTTSTSLPQKYIYLIAPINYSNRNLSLSVSNCVWANGAILPQANTMYIDKMSPTNMLTAWKLILYQWQKYSVRYCQSTVYLHCSCISENKRHSNIATYQWVEIVS